MRACRGCLGKCMGLCGTTGHRRSGRGGDAPLSRSALSRSLRRSVACFSWAARLVWLVWGLVWPVWRHTAGCRRREPADEAGGAAAATWWRPAMPWRAQPARRCRLRVSTRTRRGRRHTEAWRAVRARHLRRARPSARSGEHATCTYVVHTPRIRRASPCIRRAYAARAKAQPGGRQRRIAESPHAGFYAGAHLANAPRMRASSRGRRVRRCSAVPRRHAFGDAARVGSAADLAAHAAHAAHVAHAARACEPSIRRRRRYRLRRGRGIHSSVPCCRARGDAAHAACAPRAAHAARAARDVSSRSHEPPSRRCHTNRPRCDATAP
jgi:hypothetical protein